MQNSFLKILKAQVENELVSLDELHISLNRRVAWLVEGKVTDPFLIEDIFAALAMSLHAFYTGCERIVLRLLNNIDGGLVKSSEWHQELLRQAALPIPDIRSPILTDPEVLEFLSELRGLRHVIRNLYINQLKKENLLEIGKMVKGIYPKFKMDIDRFLATLEPDS